MQNQHIATLAIKAWANGGTLYGADLYGADLGGANLFGAALFVADLRGANLYGADLRGANLRGANLRGANLRGANLHGADLGGADLGGANLFRANLGGAKIAEYVLIRLVSRARRTRDSYEFLCFATEAGPLLIRAGCRTLTLDQYRAHVAADYPDTPKAAETLAILDLFERVAGIVD